MIKFAVNIKEFDFSPYGYYYNLYEDRENVYKSEGENYIDYMTKMPLIDTYGHLGLTIGDAAPYTVKSMERHDHTKEALFCASKPIVVCVALSVENEEIPSSKNIVAVILNPGDVVVLDRNVWHDACHGLGEKTGYYYLASKGKNPAEWIDVIGEPVEIRY